MLTGPVAFPGEIREGYDAANCLLISGVDDLGRLFPSSRSRSPLMALPFLFFGQIGMGELVIIVMVGLLLFGRRLPEVSRQLGKSVVEFKKGFADIENQMRDADRVSDEAARRPAVTTTPATNTVNTPAPEAAVGASATVDSSARTDETSKAN